MGALWRLRNASQRALLRDSSVESDTKSARSGNWPTGSTPSPSNGMDRRAGSPPENCVRGDLASGPESIRVCQRHVFERRRRGTLMAIVHGAVSLFRLSEVRSLWLEHRPHLWTWRRWVGKVRMPAPPESRHVHQY